MNPDDNKDVASTQNQATSPNVGTVITPTTTQSGSGGQNFFQPTVQPSREQSPIVGPAANTGNPQLNNIPNPSNPTKPKKSKVMVVVIAAVAVLLVMTVVAVIVSGSAKKKPAPTTDSTQQQPTGPQPASALDVEQSNNSINQDMSSVSDEDDFPEVQIDDKALGL